VAKIKLSKRKNLSSRDLQNTNQLGEFLAKSRSKKSLTLAEVAEKIGLKSGQSVWDWENGKGSGIPAKTLLRLVKLYGAPAEVAYQLLLDFHQTRVQKKIMQKFETARTEILGRKRGS
jgi:transcriptional regulator with XRE-family HTH domain